jgi:hypothetical protein
MASLDGTASLQIKSKTESNELKEIAMQKFIYHPEKHKKIHNYYETETYTFSTKYI